MLGSPLLKLISLEEEGSSEGRRALLREVTDAFMVASDRYHRRDMAVFDLLLSRTATAMDVRLRRIITVALARAGAREEIVHHAISQIASPNERFLRRSVTQTVRDLCAFLIENSDGPGPTEELSLDDGNSLTLPSLLTYWLYQYQLSFYCENLTPLMGAERTGTLLRSADRFREEVIKAASDAGREEVVIARRTIKDWTKHQTMTDDILVELLEARAMTEFIFACTTMFKLDVATLFRSLNDQTFESLAIIAKAHNVRRAVFAKTVFGFRHRRTDEGAAERVLPIYDRLPQETAERALRFLALRIAEASGTDDNDGDTLRAAS